MLTSAMKYEKNEHQDIRVDPTILHCLETPIQTCSTVQVTMSLLYTNRGITPSSYDQSISH